MKLLLQALVAILLLAVMNCEGRTTRNHALAEDIEEFKKDTIIEKTTYFPQEHEETINDTILSNGYRIKVRFFSDMNSQILDEVTKENIVYKQYHREFNAHLTIIKNDKEIFNKVIDKNFFKRHQEVKLDALAFSIMSNVAIDSDLFLNNKNLNVEIWFNKINTDFHHIYTLAFNEDGFYGIDNVKEIEF